MRGILIAIMLLLVPLTSGQAPQDPGMPEQAHVTLADDGLWIHFSLSAIAFSPAETPQVTYSIEGGAEETVEAAEVGQVTTTTSTSTGTTVYAAKVEAEPGQSVTYSVGSMGRGMHGPFEVAVPPASEVRFVAFGDIGLDGVGLDGEDDGSMAGGSPPIRVRDLALQQDPGLFIIPGDLPYQFGQLGWDPFMRMQEPLQATVPTMPVQGNHEYDDDSERGDADFLATYVLPNNEHDYAFQAGPVTFIGLNSDHVCLGTRSRTDDGNPADPCPQGERNEEQLTWLEGALTAAQEDAAPWTVVYFHHPLYSHGRHDGDIGIRSMWIDLLEDHDVDLVLTAHDHLYSRSHPIRDGEMVLNDTVYPKGAGPIHITTGGGGRALYTIEGEAPPWHAAGGEFHHITVADANATHLQVEVIDVDGTTRDAFTIDSTLALPDDTPDNASPGPAMVGLLVLLAMVAALRRR